MRKCSNCGQRWRSLSFFKPMTPQAVMVSRRRYMGFDKYPVNAVRLCTACIVDLTYRKED